MTGQRGALTREIQKVAESRLGRKISMRELRLMAYVDYKLKNEHKLDPRHVSDEERTILSGWRKAGWLEGGASEDSLGVSKAFYDTMQEVLWLGYVICE